MDWRHLHPPAASNTGVGDAVHRWPNGTEHPNFIINHEKLRVSTNRPPGTSDAHTDPSASPGTRRWQERGAEETQEEVGSFPREESLLLRWTDHSGPTDWGPTPNPGPYSHHKWIILYIWVSSCFISGPRSMTSKGQTSVHLRFPNNTEIWDKLAL